MRSMILLNHNNRGDISIEAAIIFPLVLIMALSFIQFAMWWFAIHLLKDAARDGLDAARLNTGNYIEVGKKAADQTASQAPYLVSKPTSDVDLDNGNIVVTVNATLDTMGLNIPIMSLKESAQAPLENWR